MKNLIILLTFAAIGVNAQSPFDIYFSSLYNRPQNTQLKYQSYQPYKILSTTRRPYVPVITTPAPTIFSSYKSQTVGPKPYKPFQISTTRRPFFPVVSTQSPVLIPSHSATFKPYQILTPTLRPYVPISPSALKPYKTPIYFAPTTAYYNNVDRFAHTLRSDNHINPDGSYNWSFETNNGIAAAAQGSHKRVGRNPYQVSNDVRGSFSWTAPNGERYYYTYTADENGYHPKRVQLPGVKY